MEGVGAALGEIGTEAVAADIFHFVLVREWGNGVVWELDGEGFVEPDEVGEAAADLRVRFREGGEVGLGQTG